MKGVDDDEGEVKMANDAFRGLTDPADYMDRLISTEDIGSVFLHPGEVSTFS